MGETNNWKAIKMFANSEPFARQSVKHGESVHKQSVRSTIE